MLRELFTLQQLAFTTATKCLQSECAPSTIQLYTELAHRTHIFDLLKEFKAITHLCASCVLHFHYRPVQHAVAATPQFAGPQFHI